MARPACGVLLSHRLSPRRWLRVFAPPRPYACTSVSAFPSWNSGCFECFPHIRCFRSSDTGGEKKIRVFLTKSNDAGSDVDIPDAYSQQQVAHQKRKRRTWSNPVHGHRSLILLLFLFCWLGSFLHTRVKWGPGFFAMGYGYTHSRGSPFLVARGLWLGHSGPPEGPFHLPSAGRSLIMGP